VIGRRSDYKVKSKDTFMYNDEDVEKSVFLRDVIIQGNPIYDYTKKRNDENYLGKDYKRMGYRCIDQ
jgi:hypothetical protein